MTLCPRCQRPLPEPLARFCIHCGASLEGVHSPEDARPSEDARSAEEPRPTEEVGPPANGGDTKGEAGEIPHDAHEPAASPGEARAGAPWDRRAQVGFLTALVDTTLQVLGRPRAFYRQMALTGGAGGPLLYGVLLGYVGLLATAVYDAIFEAIVGAQSPELDLGPELERAMAMLQGGPGLLAQVLIGPLAIAIGLLVASALNHATLLLLGGARAGFEATFRVSAYSKATSLVSLVPMCGPLLAVVWGAVVAIIGLQEAHQTTLGKAIAAVLLPILLVCCCCLGSLGLMVAALASTVR